MKVYFLGTGTSQGIPVIGSTHPVSFSDDPKDKRLRVSILISWEEAQYLIDCGPDFRQQMLKCGCTRIDGILFTHEHADHTAGLDDIRPYSLRQGKIPIYLNKKTLDSLERRFDYIFETENRYPGAPEVTVNLISEKQKFNLSGIEVQPILANHGFIDVLGFRFGDFAYLTDVKSIEKTESQKLLGVKVLVVNALREEPHPTHFSLQEALNFIQEIKPERAYLTHISHMLGFHQEVQNKLPKNVYLAYDNLEITI